MGKRITSDRALERKVAKKRKKSSKGKENSILGNFFKTFVIAFLVFMVLCTPAMAMVGGFLSYKPFDPDAPAAEEKLDLIVPSDSPFFEEFKDSKRVNVLLLGVNSGLTDTIMLVSFDKESQRVDVISVPRDTYYHRKGYDSQGECKINAAYKGDPVNSAKAVSDVLLGMPINYYAVVDYKGVANIVDSMGGVPMDIPNIQNKGGMYYRDPYDTPPLKIALPAGPRVLDGKEAVQFLRFRHGYTEGDIGRVKAQQQFVKSAFKQCLSFKLPIIAKTVVKNVKSNIDIGTAISLANKAAGMTSEDIHTHTIPYTPQPEAPFYVYPKSQELADMISEIYSVKSKDSKTE